VILHSLLAKFFSYVKSVIKVRGRGTVSYILEKENLDVHLLQAEGDLPKE
jgi:hypothetical protein